MKRASKVLFCMLTIALVLCSVALPCFAIEVTVEADGWNDLGFSNRLTAFAPTDFNTANSEGYFSLAQTETVVSLAEEMYKANAFNGLRPVLITLSQSEYGYEVLFWCNRDSLNLTSYNNIYITKNELSNERAYFSLPTLYNVRSVISYLPKQNGSVQQTTYPFINEILLDTSFESDHNISVNGPHATWYYAYFNGLEWEYNPEDPLCACSNTDTVDYGNPVNSFANALRQWENANKGTFDFEPVQYQLDIPSIITAIPNGAKQIINNAFGFEIFGINVAGLLSVLLIVTIVAFVVRWLMSR